MINHLVRTMFIAFSVMHDTESELWWGWFSVWDCSAICWIVDTIHMTIYVHVALVWQNWTLNVARYTAITDHLFKYAKCGTEISKTIKTAMWNYAQQFAEQHTWQSAYLSSMYKWHWLKICVGWYCEIVFILFQTSCHNNLWTHHVRACSSVMSVSQVEGYWGKK